MFCPNCHVYLQETHLIKRNVKKFENAIIEYDARCPSCLEEIGHMHWGVFTPAERFRSKEDKPTEAPPSETPPPPQPPEDAPPFAPPENDAPPTKEVKLDWPKSSSSGACTCPYCGRLLPKEYRKIDLNSKA
ncbi:MAG TPA: hypothetical protein GX499_06245 [Clostridiales bacterium]|nr:hypothetical protein [Clostridiales bacterium]